MARILIVDDEPAYCRFLGLAFGSAGHEVFTATTGGAALGVAQQFVPHLVVTDWMLRNCYTGSDVCHLLRQLNPSIRTVLMTGYIDAMGREVREVDRVIPKPFGLEEIQSVVRELLGEAE